MWKSRVRLNAGESLKLLQSEAKGHLGQEEVEHYSIVDGAGKVTGTVQFTDLTATKAPFRRSLHLVQRDSTGTKVIDERWNG